MKQIIFFVMILGLALFMPSRAVAQTAPNLLPFNTAPTPTAVVTTPVATLSPEERIINRDLGGLSLLNPLQHVIKTAVERGMSAQTLVLLLLFPVVATMVAFSRQIIGIAGFNVFTPAAFAVVLLTTGITNGLVAFLLMTLVAIIGRFFISYLKLEYTPRAAMLLWFVSFGVFLLMFVMTMTPLNVFFGMESFPLLILVLLSEDFMTMQSELKWRLSLTRSFQIMFLSVLGALIMGNRVIQQFALTRPELVVIGAGVINVLIGKYLGLRLTEYLRFRPIIDQEE